MSAPRATAAYSAPGVAADQVELLLAPIVAGLPIDLKARLIGAPAAGRTVLVPLETVVNQLAFGMVKIPFGEFRRLVPDIFAHGAGDHDQRPVILPLQEILSRINPAMFSRRAAQQMEVDDAIAGPFGGQGRGITFTAQPLKPAAPTTTPAAAPRFTTPEPGTPLRDIMPVATPIPFRPSPPIPAPAEPAGIAMPGQGESQELPPYRFSPSPVPPAPIIPAPMAPSIPWPPAEAQPTISVLLGDLADAWPEEIKREVIQGGFAMQPIMLSAAAIEPGMKRGRVTMSWKDLRTLARPNSPDSPQDGLELELPLKIIAPAFLAAQKSPSRPKSKVMVSSEIPNLFFGFPQPGPEPAAPPAPPARAPLPFAPAPSGQGLPPRPIVVTSAAFNPAAPKPDTNFFPANPTAAEEEAQVFQRQSAPATDFLKRQIQPKDVVAGAVKLPGVAGAVVAIADGLRVASETPAGMNADTVAAFLPQIYDRVNQSTRELRMGALNNLNFTVGDVPWKIFRMNSVYFAVFGRAGQPLPSPQLVALAAGLERKQ